MSTNPHDRRVANLARQLAASGEAEPNKSLLTKEETAASYTGVSHTLSRIYHGIAGSTEDSELHGGHLVAKVLHSHGVKAIFTLSGGHISPILVASQEIGIKIVDVRHEVNAVFAADAVSRLSGIPGVAAVTAGPGVTNTITAIKNAQMAQSPLILLGGASPTALAGRGALQDIDQESVLRPICKFCYTCESVRDIVPALKAAFQSAMSGVPGPVYVGLPLDVLYPILELKAVFGMVERSKDIQPSEIRRVVVPVEQKRRGVTRKKYIESLPPNTPVFLEKSSSGDGNFLMNTYAKWKIRDLYSGAFDPSQEFSPLPVDIPMPSASCVSSSETLLRNARKPILLIGSQAMLRAAPDATRLQQAVEKMGIPCFLGGMARGLMGRNHPLHIRQNRGAALKEADVVILAGTVCDFRLQYGKSLSSKSKIVTVNRSPQDLTINSDRFWTPEVKVLGDPCEFLLALAEKVNPRVDWTSWQQKLKHAEIEKEKQNEKMAAATALGRGTKEGQTLINSLHLCQEIEKILPDNSILVADGGDFVATASYILRPRGPLKWLDPGAFGTLGVGGGFALGAKIVYPEAQVWIIWGDGSAGYSIAEIDTYKRHGLNVISVIGNDACWTQIEREQISMFRSDVACPLAYCAYHTVSEGYGGAGVELREPSEVSQGIRAAQEIAVTQNVPVVINAHIGKTSFREGSISV